MHRMRAFVSPTAATAACLALWLAAPAAAEGFIDLYAGAGFIDEGRVDFRADDASITTDPATIAAFGGDTDYETSPSFGLRGGYWFEGPPSFIGLGLDLSYYRAFDESSFAPFDVWAFPMTPLLMLRAPIASSPGFPGGRVQPYVAVGPSFTISAARADLSELGIGLDDFEDASFDVGLDARGGLAIQVARNFALFGEYRFTYLEPEYDDEVDDALGPPDFEADIDLEPELEGHHLVFGVSFRF